MKENKWYTALETQREDQTNRLQFKKQLIIRTFTTHLIWSHCKLIAAILTSVLSHLLTCTHLIFSTAAGVGKAAAFYLWAGKNEKSLRT